MSISSDCTILSKLEYEYVLYISLTEKERYQLAIGKEITTDVPIPSELLIVILPR